MEAVWDLGEAALRPFQYGFMVRALLASVTVGVVCGIIGSYVVLRGLAFMGDAVAHAVFPGVVIAYLLGVNLLVGAVLMGMATAVGIGTLARRTVVSEDTAIGILFAGAFALGLLLLSFASGAQIDLQGLLLGNVLAVSRGELLAMMCLASLVAVVLGALHKELVFHTFDPVGATAAGLPTGPLAYLLLILLALVVVVSLQTVGIILVVAMLVTPAATAYLLAERFVPMMLLAALLGAAAAAGGLYLSFHINVASGASMVLVSTGLFLLAALAAPRQGLLRSRRR